MCAYSTIACICLENDNEQINLAKFGSTQLKCKSLQHMVCGKTRGQTQKVECFCFHWPSTVVDCTVVACNSNNDFFFLKNLETWNAAQTILNWLELCHNCCCGDLSAMFWRTDHQSWSDWWQGFDQSCTVIWPKLVLISLCIQIVLVDCECRMS